MLPTLVKIILIDTYNCIYCLYLCYHDTLSYTCVHAIYVCSSGALWQAFYRILIDHPCDTYDCLLMYIIYITTDINFLPLPFIDMSACLAFLIFCHITFECFYHNVYLPALCLFCCLLIWVGQLVHHLFYCLLICLFADQLFCLYYFSCLLYKCPVLPW